MFGTVDWLVVGVYLAAMIGVGLVAGRGQRSKRDYFLGDRQLSWWTVGLSIVATETSALTIIGVPAMAFGVLEREAAGGLVARGGNLLFMQIVVGYVLARVIVALVMVPHYFKGDVYTPYQLLTRAFGPQPRTLAAVLSLLNMCLQAGVRVYVTAIPVMIVMRTVVPSWGIWRSIVLFSVAALLYTTVGGIRAVVVTDAVQFFIFFFGGLFALLYIPTLLPPGVDGSGGGWSALLALGSEKLKFWSWGVDSRQVGQSLGAWLWANVVLIFGGDFNIWMGLVGATVGVMVSHGADQLNVQRVLACKNERDGRRALLLSAAIIAPQFLMFLLVGLGLFAFYSARSFDFGSIAPWDPTSPSLVPKADYVFPIFVVTQMPPVIKGLLTAGILAAAMSSLTSALSAISSVAVMDLWRPLRGISGEAADGRKELRWGRWGTLGASMVLMVVAWWAKDAPLIFNFVFSFAGIFSGAKLGAMLWAMWRKRGAAAPIIAAMLISAVAMAAIVILSRARLISINWPWYASIGTAICIGVARLLSRFSTTPPTSLGIAHVTPDEI